MVIQTDVYPGVGYVGYPQQQGYVMHQQSQYPTNVYYSRVSGTQMVPIPYTTSPQYPNHHGMFYGGHNQNEGWKEMNKHQDGWCSESGHQGVGYDSNDQKQENWIEMNKQQDGWYGGSGHPGLGYDSIDPSKFSQVGKVPSNGRRVQHDQAVPSNGYGVYHDQTVPSNGYGAPATWGSDQPYPSQGYQTVEYWAIKGYGAPATWGSDQPYPSQGYQTVEYWAIKGV